MAPAIRYLSCRADCCVTLGTALTSAIRSTCGQHLMDALLLWQGSTLEAKSRR